MFIYRYGFIIGSIYMKFRIINRTMKDFFIQKKIEVGEWYSPHATKIGEDLLIHLRQTHFKLCKIGTDVTNFCATTFLCCLVSILYGVTRGLFNLYLLIVGPTLNICLLFNNIFWILLLFYPIWLLSMNVTKCLHEVVY